MRSRPIHLIVAWLIPLCALLVATAGCAQWSRAVPAAVPDVAARSAEGDIIVITAERKDAMSQAQAIAIESFNREALDVLGNEGKAHGFVKPLDRVD